MTETNTGKEEKPPRVEIKQVRRPDAFFPFDFLNKASIELKELFNKKCAHISAHYMLSLSNPIVIARILELARLTKIAEDKKPIKKTKKAKKKDVWSGLLKK